MKITIELPSALYADLAELAKQQHEPCFGPENFCEELIASELASRRLTVTPGRSSSNYEPVEHHVRLAKSHNARYGS